MKPLNELTDTELVALTGEEIEQIIARELMVAGIPKPVPPVLGELTPVDEPKRVFHRVKIGGSYGASIVLTDADDAATVVECLQRLDVVTSEYGSDFKKQYAKPVVTYETETVRLYTMDEYEKVKDDISNNKVLQERNEKEQSRFTEESKASAETRDDVLRIISDAHDRVRQAKRIVSTWKEYVETCDGDKTLAMKFLQKLYSVERIMMAAAHDDTIDIATLERAGAGDATGN